MDDFVQSPRLRTIAAFALFLLPSPASADPLPILEENPPSPSNPPPEEIAEAIAQWAQQYIQNYPYNSTLMDQLAYTASNYNPLRAILQQAGLVCIDFDGVGGLYLSGVDAKVLPDVWVRFPGAGPSATFPFVSLGYWSVTAGRSTCL